MRSLNVENSLVANTPNPGAILVISDSFHELPEAVALLCDAGCRVGYVHALKKLQDIPPDETPVSVAEAEAIVMGRVMTVDAAALDLAPKLRVIALHTSGSDNVDLAAATKRGILVTNVKGSNAEQCADFAMGLMLSTVRQIVKGDKAMRQGKWASETLSSHDVVGATLGMIGLGQIGKAVVKRAFGFDMKILVYTRTPDHAFAERYGVTYTSLEHLLKTSDIICLAASLTPETRHMINEKEFNLMKKTAFFINIARGELVDESALYNALKNEHIAGAGLDVYEEEPLYRSPLFDLENVVLTPHQAGLTVSGKVGAAVRAARNALAVLAGEIPKDAVNPEAAEKWSEKV
jgi:phosphoglycerate dehydrogenase-like enzyme